GAAWCSGDSGAGRIHPELACSRSLKSGGSRNAPLTYPLPPWAGIQEGGSPQVVCREAAVGDAVLNTFPRTHIVLLLVLFRAAVACLPQPLSRPGLRNQAVRQDQRGAAAAPGAGQARL